MREKLRGLLDFFLFILEALSCLLPPYARFSFFFQQFLVVGVRSIPIILVVGSFVGMVLAVMTYAQFSKLGIESLMGPFIAVPMVSQLGPVMTALMLLCRVGSAMTAELGTMRVTEQIDALVCFGVNPMRNLIIPRLVIGSLILPMLTVISDVVGIVGGWLLAVHVYGVNQYYYDLQTEKYFDLYDVNTGLVKAFFFGLIITFVCCFKGYNTRGGATGVGKSIMEGVVISFIAIIVCNFFISIAAAKLSEIIYG